jgi:hypothetical protein
MILVRILCNDSSPPIRLAVEEDRAILLQAGTVDHLKRWINKLEKRLSNPSYVDNDKSIKSDKLVIKALYESLYKQTGVIEVLPSNFKKERPLDDLATTRNDRSVQSRTTLRSASTTHSEDKSAH